ncbi:putative ABC multidrug transporter [Xylariaceae sp. FL1272]|nr:putative ABC multidrug transporter [Xylariaceae sp. FL1272]
MSFHDETHNGVADKDGNSPSGLTVTFRNVAVEVDSSTQSYVNTVMSVVSNLAPKLGHGSSNRRHILQGVTAQVVPGEMLLVLGRPGSGCTTLLKVLANMRREFTNVTGDVHYGSMSSRQAETFRHQIVMNTEDDQHFPTLKVSEIMEFAVKTKLPKQDPDNESPSIERIENHRNTIMDSLGISHTAKTQVGDEFIRGVSGGERKRVSLAEVMATRASVQCWDNSTRGLDASNALDFAKVLRRHADNERKTMIATLYQAGNGIYDQFDKVLVLAEGRMIYFGPTSTARQYFESLGFRCPPGANVADFLTSVTVATERDIAPEYEATAPKTAEEFEHVYQNSDICKIMQYATITDQHVLAAEVNELKQKQNLEHSSSLDFLSQGTSTSVYHSSLLKQIYACTKRQLQVLWGDRQSNALRLASNVVVALISGSLFYNLPSSSDVILDRAGSLFWPIIYLGLNCLSETTASFMGRPIFSRHKMLAFARPAAQAIACTISDIPITIVGVSLFEIIYYFLVGFERTAAKFFTQWFIFVVYSLCLLSFFRMIGAWNTHFGIASQISGWLTMIIMVYAGYLIPIRQMHPWFKWIAYINPVQYTFHALIGSEDEALVFECVEPEFLPFGNGYTESQYRGCTTPGSVAGQSMFSGVSFLNAQYGDFSRHVWRNVGIVIAFWIFFAILATLGFEMNLDQSNGSKILFEKTAHERSLAERDDTEKALSDSDYDSSGAGLAEATGSDKKGTVFTFRDINYFVRAEGAEKQLLQNVSGFVQPGQLVALMGSSGAGKTTLMDVLSQRKDYGRITGSILINGQPQGITFQRDTGYCEQNDVHEASATVREALLFAARLRQPHSVPDDEKIAYVEYIMDLLELGHLQHAIIGSPSSGLSIEQRKRVTIATELVAKPSLLFLDEPTSGLDGQSAYQICRFMKKLAAAGQTIICTIHQPSSVLFETFDVLLLLAKGGHTTFFGETGKNAEQLLRYFSDRGLVCPADTNPAEYIVDVVQGRFGTDIDWPLQWQESKEREAAMARLSELEQIQDDEKRGDTKGETATAGEKSFSAPILYQIRLVTTRQLVALWRNPDYVWNKIGLHVSNGLFSGFTFYQIGNGVFDVQLRLMSVFNFLFVAPGCINQLQPMFIHNRDIFETREKKSKTYSWIAFISAQLLSEIILLVVCATVYFVSWYFTSGFPVDADISGQVYLQMIFYEFLYTSIGQAIAAYSPNPYFAALANPILVGTLIQFSGVLVPYDHIQPFWRYWLYYLNPFNYLVGGLLVPVTWSAPVECLASELTTIPLPPNSTCGEYMADFLASQAGYVVDSADTQSCEYCPYSSGADYLATLNLGRRSDGWRDVGITALFCISSYALVFLMMRLRTKATKTAN